MGKIENFKEQLINGYATSGDAITIGAAKFENEPQKEVQIKIPLKTLNRHGLIAGATGTGKTVTLQIIAENMCNAGIPVLLMDLKGDLSGISKAGVANAKIEERHKAIGIEFQTKGTTSEFLTLSKEPGVRLRATVSEFGPVLILTQQELLDNVSTSELATKYNETIDRESAYEILTGKITAAEETEEKETIEKPKTKKKEEKSVLEKASENTMVRQIGRTVMKEVARGLLGVLGLGGSSRKKKGWF